MIRANVWSGPRNVSTAVMYSFRQHPRVTVVDEPLYGHWLRVSGTDHPGRAEVLAAMETDGERVVERLRGDDWPTDALVCKQMAHHLVGVCEDWVDDFVNVLLIRDPHDVLVSYAKAVDHPDLAMLGYPTLVRLMQREANAGREPLVVDSRDLLSDPAGAVAAMCDRIGLEFDPAMLSWPAGPKPEDGVWAPHWYARVHASTGFVASRRRSGEVPAHLRGVLHEAMPLYEELRARAWR